MREANTQRLGGIGSVVSASSLLGGGLGESQLSFSYHTLSISMKRIASLSVSMHSNAFAQFSRYRAETLQVGRGQPRRGRGGVKNVGSAPGRGVGIHIIF